MTLGRYEIAFGPYPLPLFPGGYELAVVFAPEGQPEGLEGANAVRREANARLVYGDAETIPGELSKEAKRLDGVIDDLADLLGSGKILLALPPEYSEGLAAELAGWRETFARIRREAGSSARPFAFPVFRRTEREVVILTNHAIDLRAHLDCLLEEPVAPPRPLDTREIDRSLDRARRVFLFETVLLSDDPDDRAGWVWVPRLTERLKSWDSVGPPGPTPTVEIPRRVAAQYLECLAWLADDLARMRSSAQPGSRSSALLRNAWYLRLAEAIDRIEEGNLSPIGKSILGQAGLSLLAADDRFETIAQRYVEEMRLTDWRREDFAESILRTRELADVLLGATQPPTEEERDLEAEVLHVLENASRPPPDSLASILPETQEVALGRRRLSLVLATLLSAMERMETQTDGPGEADQKWLRRELDSLADRFRPR